MAQNQTVVRVEPRGEVCIVWLDRPPVNAAIAALAAKGIAQNAPVTLLNYAGGHHGFEAVDDTDATRFSGTYGFG